LAKITEQIVVADLSPVQLQLNRENAQRLGYAGAIERWVECDICNLQPHFGEAAFDAVVCYGGPLSYVFNERERALAELLRVTRPGGRLFLGVMSLWGTLHHFLPGVLQIDPAVNRKIITSGDIGPEQSAASTHFCHMYRAAELRAFLERAGAEIEVLSASDCLSATWAEPLEAAQKDEATWQHLLEMEIEACREPGCLDMGTHLIAVCRKAG
jgi:SAM-dependent methyltransferase